MDTCKPYWVYVIKCDEDRYYIGLSEDTVVRLDEHNKGLSKWTSRYKNWQIVYTKRFDNLTDARKWENYFKRQKGGNGFKKIISP